MLICCQTLHESLAKQPCPTSAYLPFAGRLEFALEKLGADRILFGTDLTIRDIPSQLGRILGTKMSDEDRKKILYDNAAGLLGIESRVQNPEAQAP